MSAILSNLSAPPLGVVPVLPLRHFPQGKVRVRLRPGEVPTVYVRNAEGITAFLPHEVDGHWEPLLTLGKNARL
jgi:hypothetical protein